MKESTAVIVKQIDAMTRKDEYLQDTLGWNAIGQPLK